MNVRCKPEWELAPTKLITASEGVACDLRAVGVWTKTVVTQKEETRLVYKHSTEAVFHADRANQFGDIAADDDDDDADNTTLVACDDHDVLETAVITPAQMAHHVSAQFEDLVCLATPGYAWDGSGLHVLLWVVCVYTPAELDTLRRLCADSNFTQYIIQLRLEVLAERDAS